MCVIYGCETNVPDEKQLALSEDCNPDGAGVAWIEKGKDNTPIGVRWVKGLDYKGVLGVLESKGVQLPLMIHFRAASIGGKGKELTHPFPVTKDCSLALEGIAPAALMHNGHWGGWNEALFWSMLTSGSKVPRGAMSDSRAIALIAAHQGFPILNFFPSGSGRKALLTVENLYTYGEGWTHKKDLGYYQSAEVWAGKSKSGRVQNGYTGPLHHSASNPSPMHPSLRDREGEGDSDAWWVRRGLADA